MNKLKRLLKKYRKWKQPLGTRNKKLLKILLFLIKFGLASLPLYVIYFSNINFRLLENSEVFFTSLLLEATGIDFHIVEAVSPDTGFVIPVFRIGDTFLGVDRPCTGYRSYFALLGLMFATPDVSLRRKFKGALFGGIAIYFINILRLWVTGIIANYNPQSLSWVDKILWGWGLLFIVLVLWLIWIKADSDYLKDIEDKVKKVFG